MVFLLTLNLRAASAVVMYSMFFPPFSQKCTISNFESVHPSKRCELTWTKRNLCYTICNIELQTVLISSEKALASGAVFLLSLYAHYRAYLVACQRLLVPFFIFVELCNLVGVVLCFMIVLTACVSGVEFTHQRFS